MQTEQTKKKNQSKEDFEIVRQILDGNVNAFSLLQNKYQKIIASLIRRMIKNEDDVEDLTQETFIKAYNALTSYQYGYSFSSWIYKIASNTCIDFLRKKRYNTISLNQQYDSNEEQEMEIPDIDSIPDMAVLSEERKNVIIEAIENLPDNYKMIIKLRHEEELDYNEISSKLNIPLGTVKAHLFRARKILYNHLKKNLYLFT